MVFLAFASCFNAAKKSDIRISESSNWIKTAGVMAWRWAISNTSTIAHSTSSGLGSRDCSISLFIEPLTSVSVFMYSGQNRHSAGTLCFCAVQYCTPLQLLTWRSPRPGGGSSAWMHDQQATSPLTDSSSAVAAEKKDEKVEKRKALGRGWPETGNAKTHASSRGERHLEGNCEPVSRSRHTQRSLT